MYALSEQMLVCHSLTKMVSYVDTYADTRNHVTCIIKTSVVLILVITSPKMVCLYVIITHMYLIVLSIRKVYYPALFHIAYYLFR